MGETMTQQQEITWRFLLPGMLNRLLPDPILQQMVATNSGEKYQNNKYLKVLASEQWWQIIEGSWNLGRNYQHGDNTIAFNPRVGQSGHHAEQLKLTYLSSLKNKREKFGATTAPGKKVGSRKEWAKQEELQLGINYPVSGPHQNHECLVLFVSRPAKV